MRIENTGQGLRLNAFVPIEVDDSIDPLAPRPSDDIPPIAPPIPCPGYGFRIDLHEMKVLATGSHRGLLQGSQMQGVCLIRSPETGQNTV